MKARFEGSAGKRMLVSVLKQQRLVECDSDMAEWLAEKGELIEFCHGDSLIAQGGVDTDIFFILHGEAGVFVNQRHVTSRGPRESVGEMALVEPSALRMATVTALSPMVVLKIDGPSFFEILDQFPRAWRTIALVALDRLQQAERIHRSPNPKPVLFLGCATEDLAIAEQIQLNLKHAEIVAKIYTNEVFGPSGVPIEDLLAQIDTSDFAAFVFGTNDKVISRKEEHHAPRDNIVFELGLFMGRLGRNRAYIIKEHKSNLKIPTDLLGVIPITYVGDPTQDSSTVLAPVCSELRKVIKEVGVR